eukprot:430163_1
MFIWFWFVLYAKGSTYVDVYDSPTENTQRTHLLREIETYSHISRTEHRNLNDSIHTSIQFLPSEVMVLISGFLEKSDIHALMRSCRLLLSVCKRYMHTLLIQKFDYLLKTKNKSVNIDQLLKIPLVDSIAINGSIDMIKFLRDNPIKSAKYIGIDKTTGYGLLSFLLTKIAYRIHYFKLIVIVFNQTHIDHIYASKAKTSLSFVQMAKVNSQLNDIGAIAKLLSSGKIKINSDEWYLLDKWTCPMSVNPNLFCLVCVVIIGWGIILYIGQRQVSNNQ